MPYPNEHAARVADESDCGQFKRMNQGSGVSLILCKKGDKMVAVSYRFKKDQYTPEQAKQWLEKHNLKALSFEEASSDNVNAKLSMKATQSKSEVNGRIWSAGMHHVFVNDEPASVYVPESTIMSTFDGVRDLIKDQGRMPIGIDHLSDGVLAENEILAKMNLLDVGDVTKVGTDGQSIYILESKLTNDQISSLYKAGDIPAYSIVGSMDARPCPNGKADYVVDSIDVERVDFVQEGGCQVCKVGAEPDELILTSKKSMEKDIMAKENEAVQAEPVEEQIDEAVPVEPVEEVAKKEEVVEEKVEEEVKEDEEVVEVEEEPSEIDELKKEIADLKEMLGKSSKVSAKSSFNAESEVDKLIKAGKSTPKMKQSLIEVAEAAGEEAFMKMAASMPKMVSMKMESKLAKKADGEPTPKKEAKKELTWEEEYGDLAKQFRI